MPFSNPDGSSMTTGQELQYASRQFSNPISPFLTGEHPDMFMSHFMLKGKSGDYPDIEVIIEITCSDRSCCGLY